MEKQEKAMFNICVKLSSLVLAVKVKSSDEGWVPDG